MGGGHSALSPKFGLGTVIALFYSPEIHDMVVQVLITFFNLLSFLPTVLLSSPTPSNIQICSGRYVVVAEVPTES